MSLTRTIQKGVDTAFKAMGDLVKAGTWIQQTGAPSIDFASGVATTPTTEYPLARYIFAQYKIEEIDHETVTTKDQKVIFPRQDLPVIPNDADTFRDATGKVWQVKRLSQDAAGGVVVAQVRGA